MSTISHQEEDEFRSEDEEEEPPPKKRFKPSEETLGYLMSKPLKNDKRRTILGKFPTPAADAAHLPKLNDSVACLVPKMAKSYDNFLSKLERFTMNAMTPLTWALNELENNKEVDCSSVLRASLSLLGNASAHCVGCVLWLTSGIPKDVIAWEDRRVFQGF